MNAALTRFNHLESVPDPLVVIDPAGNVCFANEQMAAIVGTDVSQLVKRSAEEIGIPRVDPRSITPSATVRFPATIFCDSGQTVDVEVSACRSTVPEPGLIVCTFRQSTERTPASSPDTFRKFTGLFEPMNDGVIILDENELISYANPAALKMLGCERSDLDRIDLRAVIPLQIPSGEVSDDEHLHFLDEIQRYSMSIHERDGLLLRQDGEWLEIAINASPIGERGADYSGVSLCLRDVTRQRRTELFQRGQARLLQMISRSHAIDDIRVELAALIERLIPGTSALVYFAGNTADPSVPVMTDITSRKLKSLLALLTSDPLPVPCSAAANAGAPVIWDSLRRPELPDELRREYEKAGIRGCWSFPILASSQEVVGVLCLFRPVEGRPAEDDRQVIESLLGLTRFAFERVRFEKEFAEQAFNDDLTGLPNRIVLMDRIQIALERASQSDHSVALLLLDLDQFRMVNDSLGHQAGDELLRLAARRLRDGVRTDDLVARFTGDEFAVLLEPVQSEADAINVVMRIQRVFATPIEVENVEIFPSFSIGVAIGNGREDDAQALVRYADIAMHRAKEVGHGQFALFSPLRDLSGIPRLELQSRLYRALAADALQLHYQPIVSFAVNSIVGYEALVRWVDKDYGAISPEEFLPLAQHSGIMTEITAWVLDRAAQQFTDWRDRYNQNLTMGVNISPAELRDPLIVEQVGAVLARYDLDPACITLEVTEQALVDLTTTPGYVIERLRELGVRIALDDFGTGYSSLSYLERFPVDCIKIDRAFIQAARGGASRAPVASAMVDLAKTLGMTTVAEGIENDEDERVARLLGCEFGQGYYYGRPRTSQEIEASFANPPFFE